MFFWILALKDLLSDVENNPDILNVSFGLKRFISFSRSAINLRATDCTRPADNPPFTFRQRIGEILYPTNLSKILLACWASTKDLSIFLGCVMAFLIASSVISLKTIRLVLLSSNFNDSCRCQAIASPSLSSSLASQTVWTFLTSLFNFLTISFLSLLTMYLGA